MKHTITVQEVVEKEIEVDLEVVEFGFETPEIQIGDTVAILQDGRATAKLAVVKSIATDYEYELCENDAITVNHLHVKGIIDQKTYNRIEFDGFSFLRKREIKSYRTIDGQIHEENDVVLIIK